MMLWVFLALLVCYKLAAWGLARVRLRNHTDKHVLITGCDSGFGNLLTKRLDGLGFHVFAGCLTQEGAGKLQDECSTRVTPLVLDVTDLKSIAAARRFVESKLPKGTGLWGLVNNAGVCGTVGPLEWMTENDWMKVLSVNVLGMVSVTRDFLPLIRAAHGRVVNMSSANGRLALYPAPYSVSKFGVEAFSDCLRREVYNQGIKVCIVEPGTFRTEIHNSGFLLDSFKKLYEATPTDIKKHYPEFALETASKALGKLSNQIYNDVNWVIDAYELALTSRFPSTRQEVGYDIRILLRLLWNLPAPLTDWILNRAMTALLK